jgi:hypothetical protein
MLHAPPSSTTQLGNNRKPWWATSQHEADQSRGALTKQTVPAGHGDGAVAPLTQKKAGGHGAVQLAFVSSCTAPY